MKEERRAAENTKNINEALRLLRVFSDLKSKDMANALEISPSYLSEIESGKKEPSLALLEKYSQQFKTKVSALLFFAESLDKITVNIRFDSGSFDIGYPYCSKSR
jgi:transcriptional regulator with XRE-family HTH domain